MTKPSRSRGIRVNGCVIAAIIVASLMPFVFAALVWGAFGWYGSRVKARLDARVGAREERGSPLLDAAVAPRPAEAENALTVYRRIDKIMRGDNGAEANDMLVSDLVEIGRDPWDSDSLAPWAATFFAQIDPRRSLPADTVWEDERTAARLRTSLAAPEVRECLALLDEAGQRPRCVFTGEFPTEVLVMYRAAQLALHEARRQAGDGDGAAAVANLLTAGKVVEHLRQSGVNEPHVAALHLDVVIAEMARDVARTECLTGDQLARLQADLVREQVRERLAAVVEEDIVLAGGIMVGLSAGPRLPGGKLNPASIMIDLPRHASQIAVLDIAEARRQQILTPWSNRQRQQQLAEQARGQVLFGAVPPSLRQRGDHAVFVNQVESYLLITRVGLAVLRYGEDHGQFPDTLAALVPEYLPEPPVDVWTGKPLLYARQCGHWYVRSSAKYVTKAPGPWDQSWGWPTAASRPGAWR